MTLKGVMLRDLEREHRTRTGLQLDTVWMFQITWQQNLSELCFRARFKIISISTLSTQSSNISTLCFRT